MSLSPNIELSSSIRWRLARPSDIRTTGLLRFVAPLSVLGEGSDGDPQYWHHGIDYLQAAIRAVSGDCVDGPLWAFSHDADVVPDSAARHNSPANATLLVTTANLDGEPRLVDLATEMPLLLLLSSSPRPSFRTMDNIFETRNNPLDGWIMTEGLTMVETLRRAALIGCKPRLR